MSAEEFYKQEKKVGTYEQGYCGWDMIKFAEAYHKSRVEAITDKMINKRFAVFHSKGKTSDNRKKRSGAKWFKQQLLKQ